MGNYENIRPYAEFNHKASLHGGVDAYLDEIAESNRQLGILQEKDTEFSKGLILLGAGIAAWEGGKKAIRSIKKLYKEHKEEQKAVLKRKSEVAKENIVKGVTEATEYEHLYPLEEKEKTNPEE